MAHISRRTVKLLADLYVETFRKWESRGSALGDPIYTEPLYALVYEHDGDPWLCSHLEAKRYAPELRSFIRKLHTGESVNNDTWTLAQRAAYGQKRLLELCTAILRADEDTVLEDDRAPLRSALELDGYVFRNGRLLETEGETQDVEVERGELAELYVSLGLPNLAIVKDCLEKSEEHYGAGNYRDCIGNARHYLEKVLEDVATAWSERPGAPALVIPPNQPPAGPCRNYLETVGLLTTDEKNAFRDLHGLFSGTGGHPALPERDAARVFRRLATSMAFYVLLRYQARK